MEPRNFPRGDKKQDSKSNEPHFSKKHEKKAKRLNYIPRMQKELSSLSVVLGHISGIKENYISVSLPGRMVGTIQITAVSPAYTQALNSIVEGKAMQMVYNLDDMFHFGQCLPVAVLSNSKNGTLLTTIPKNVNVGREETSVLPGKHVIASVNYQEEGGYAMDIGIPGIKAFLPNEDAVEFAQRWFNRNTLGIGQVLHCVVGETVNSVLRLKAKPSELERFVDVDNSLPPRPGYNVKVTVHKPIRNGLEVSFGGREGETGVVHKTHLMKVSQSVKDYKSGEELDACVLYVNNGFVHFSLKPWIVYHSSSSRQDSLKRIQAQNYKIDEKVSGKVLEHDFFEYYLELPDGSRAVAPKTMRDPSNKELKAGDEARGTIMGYSDMDDLYIVNMSGQVTPTDLHPGDKFKAKVTQIISRGSGIVVQINNNLMGKIGITYLVDNPQEENVKIPKEGDIVDVMVFEVCSDRKVIFTCKPSLLSMKEPIVCSISDKYVGVVTRGILLRKSDVSLFGNARGIFSYDALNHPNFKMLKHGQTIKVQIEKLNKEEGAYVVSVLYDDHTEVEKKPEQVYEVGNLLVGHVTAKSMDGFFIKLNCGGNMAYLPTHHLSDFPSIARLMHKYIQEGRILQDLFLVNKGDDSNDVLSLVTLKYTWKELDQRTLMLPLPQVLSGVVLPAMVSSVFKKLCTLSTPLASVNKIIVMSEDFCEESCNDLTEAGLEKGLSVFVKVSSQEEDTFVGTTVLPGQNDPAVTLTYLRSYVQSYHTLLKLAEGNVSGFTTGSKLSGKVNKVDSRIELKLSCGMTGIIEACDQDINVDDSLEAVVLFTDLEKDVVFLSLSPKLFGQPNQNVASSGTCRVAYTNQWVAVAETCDGQLVFLARGRFNKPKPQLYNLHDEVTIVIHKYEEFNCYLGVPTAAAKSSNKRSIEDVPSNAKIQKTSE